MGKKISIKGADFSANGINTKDLSYLVPPIVGYGITFGLGKYTYVVNAARVSNESTKFADIGVSKIKITPKTGYKVASLVDDNITENAINDAWQSVWVSSYNSNARTLDSADGNSFIIMVAPTSSSVTELTSDDWNTYFDVEITFTE